MKRKSIDIELPKKKSKVRDEAHSYRFHYHWSQIEDDRSGKLLGSRRRPLRKADRVLHLHPDRKYPPVSLATRLRKAARFQLRAKKYQTIDYNTFEKNGVVKLTEVELYFLSSKMTRSSSSEWAVVYLGIGNGERFRWIRDEFFPDLSVISFDPLDDFFTGIRSHVVANAERWTADGTNFTFLIRCFDDEADVSWIRERIGSRRLLVISDIRGLSFQEDGKTFDKGRDQDIQWRAIQRLRPESSLVKFSLPSDTCRSFLYAPGVLLKQVFSYYGTMEMRLLIDGVPEKLQRYRSWELIRKLNHHHERMRGRVYRSTLKHERAQCRCLDSCFDCTVLWDTISAYAKKSKMNPYEVLDKIQNDHIYITENWTRCAGCGHLNATPQEEGANADAIRRRSDVEFFLGHGRVSLAVAALEAGGNVDEELMDWGEVIEAISARQPALAQRLRLELPGPSSRGTLMRLLGNLDEPFTLVRSELNGLLEWPADSWRKDYACTDMSFYKTGPCHFFKLGLCLKGENCTYSHGEADVDVQAPWTNDILCWFHSKGRCVKGNGCTFSHGKALSSQRRDDATDGREASNSEKVV